jgi:transcription termination factor NusB
MSDSPVLNAEPRPNGRDRAAAPAGHPAAGRAAINRANAQNSTGPRTLAGKQRASLNALRHGLTGHVIVLPNEDRNAYERHVQRFTGQFQPKGALEQQLVQSLADTAWRLNRITAMETNLLTLGLTEHEGFLETGHPQADAALATAQAFRRNARAFSLLSIYEQRLSRLFEKTLAQLRELQAERREQENTDLDNAADLLKLHQEHEESPYNPSQDGFVFSNDDIESFVERRERLQRARRASFYRTAAG